MVRDLATRSDEGETLDRMLDMVQHIAVHTTSASAYMKLKGIGRLRKDYGLTDANDTGIPAIHRHLRDIAKEAGAEFNASMAIRRLDQLGGEVAFFFRAAAQAGSPDAATVRQRIQVEKEAFVSAIGIARSEARMKLDLYREHFLDKLKPMLSSSVQGVRRCARVGTASTGPRCAPSSSVMACSRAQATAKYYNFNDDLTEPLMSQLPVSWERYFTDDLGRVKENYVTKVSEQGRNFCEKARLIMDLVFGRQDALMEQQLAWFGNKVKLLADETEARIRGAVTQRRSELAAKMPLVARGRMLPAYASAKMECGSGMKGRILKILEDTSVQSAPPIYDTIQFDLLEGLRDLDVLILELLTGLEKAAQEQANIIAHNTVIDIDEATIDPAIKVILDSVPKPLEAQGTS
jgi:hypothetical protein